MLRLKQIPHLETLVVDALGEKLHNAHYSIQEALALSVELQPRNVFFVGMSCSLEHAKTNRRLQKWLALHQKAYSQMHAGTKKSKIEKIQLAMDGQFVPMTF
ncbi:metallo-beta-lactamase domain protein [Cystoisospora suis]|uniref:Metallo-beta-lactamase domain protein n=1 Tax=Cystoisospora suis TaxID=483139 RepID=A0A2C6L230_9APIC|nr:metallo-beta-lactamase domain protein [Cystoisospora suis]